MSLTEQQRAAAREYKYRLGEIARAARAVKAAPTGPRKDEFDGLERPQEIREGSPNPHATGPVGTPQKEPVGGRWVQGLNNTFKFVPDDSPEPETAPVMLPPAPINQGSYKGA